MSKNRNRNKSTEQAAPVPPPPSDNIVADNPAEKPAETESIDAATIGSEQDGQLSHVVVEDPHKPEADTGTEQLPDPEENPVVEESNQAGKDNSPADSQLDPNIRISAEPIPDQTHKLPEDDTTIEKTEGSEQEPPVPEVTDTTQDESKPSDQPATSEDTEQVNDPDEQNEPHPNDPNKGDDQDPPKTQTPPDDPNKNVEDREDKVVHVVDNLVMPEEVIAGQSFVVGLNKKLPIGTKIKGNKKTFEVEWAEDARKSELDRRRNAHSTLLKFHSTSNKPVKTADIFGELLELEIL